jgi:hypothetical protein
LFGAGVVGAVALAGSHTASASAPSTSGPESSGPDSTDAGQSEAAQVEANELALYAIGLELSARNLYRAAIEAGATGTAWSLLASQHGSYAERIAGLTGISANRADTALYAAREADFTGDSPANAAYALENALVATHAALVGMIDNVSIANALASIAAMESRHAAYLAERSGRGDNFEALFQNAASPMLPGGGS